MEGGLGGSSQGAEGTAILEIVHDIAPSAQLRFANFSTHLEFIVAVDFLAANSDVVIDDIGWFGFAYDQSSPVSANTTSELNNDANPIRGYYTSVGNQALRHYQEIYVDAGTDGGPFVGVAGAFHQFDATADTTDCAGSGQRIANVMQVGPGQTAAISLTWDDSFGTAATDYDLYVFRNDTGALVASSFDDNINVTGEPVERVAFTNSAAVSKFFDIAIQNFDDASAGKTFDMFVFGGVPFCDGAIFNYNTSGSSVPAQSDAGGGVVSVGAISATDPASDDIEPFSSHGPANNGALKPDVSAIDGVSVTGAGGFPSTFFGTSAAAPHVAGLAALLLDLERNLKAGEAGDNPVGDRLALRAAILGSAVDLGAAGPDNIFGSGRVSALATGESVSPTPPAPPTSVTAVAGNATATVARTAPSSDGGSPITQYTVTSNPDGLVAAVDGSTLTAEVAGLTNGTAYTFTVVATNVAGTSVPSAPSNSVTPQGPPDPPTGVTAVAGNATATVAWIAPSSDGGSPITQYTVTSNPDGLVAAVDGSTLTAEVIGLTNVTAYTFTVVATNVVGTSVPSAPSNSVTPTLPPPVPALSAAALAVLGAAFIALLTRAAWRRSREIGSVRT